MLRMSSKKLRAKVIRFLRSQGFVFKNGQIYLPHEVDNKECLLKTFGVRLRNLTRENLSSATLFSH